MGFKLQERYIFALERRNNQNPVSVQEYGTKHSVQYSRNESRITREIFQRELAKKRIVWGPSSQSYQVTYRDQVTYRENLSAHPILLEARRIPFKAAFNCSAKIEQLKQRFLMQNQLPNVGEASIRLYEIKHKLHNYLSFLNEEESPNFIPFPASLFFT